MDHRHGLEPLAAGLEERQQLDPAVDRLAAAAKPVAAGPARTVLSGQWLGHAFHPLLTDVPLGCWTSASLLDLLGGTSSRSASQRLVGLGILTSLPTAAAGLSDWAHIDRRSQRVGVVHAGLNGAVLALYGASYVARRRGRHTRGVALGMAGGLVAIASGFLGGHLTLTAAVTRDNVLLPHDDDQADAPAVEADTAVPLSG